MKSILAFLFLFLVSAALFSQNPAAKFPRHPLEQMETLQSRQPRFLLVFITADWCSYCKLMKNTVFKNPGVAQKLKEGFYFAELNGEWRDPIFFGNKAYRFQPTGLRTGTHELATLLGTVNGKLSYPTLVILNSNNEVLYRYRGYLNSKELLELLSYFEK